MRLWPSLGCVCSEIDGRPLRPGWLAYFHFLYSIVFLIRMSLRAAFTGLSVWRPTRVSSAKARRALLTSTSSGRTWLKSYRQDPLSLSVFSVELSFGLHRCFSCGHFLYLST